MKTFFIPLVLLLSFLKPAEASAQYRHWNDRDDAMNEISLGDGFVTLQELEGWDGRGGMSGYVSMPSSVTGALHLNYRRFITHKFAIGITAGIDNESGDLSYGNPEHSQFGYDGVSGHYNVRTYTIAIEPLLAYIRKSKFMFYGYVGMGMTSFENKFRFYDDVRNPEFFYGKSGLVPSNPYNYHAYFFNAQVTPIGIRFGDKVAGFVEFGFGYKGLFSMGLSAKF